MANRLSATASGSWRSFDAEADRLARALRSERLTLLTGATGVGKSSLLHGGLLPLLHRRTGDLPREPRPDPTRVVVPFPDRRSRPAARESELVIACDRWSDAPLAAIERELDAALGLPAAQTRPALPSAWPARLASLSRQRNDVRLLFVFDHFEQVLERGQPSPEQRRFLDAWIEAVSTPGLNAHFLIALDEAALPLLQRIGARLPGYEDLTYVLKALPHRQVLLPLRRSGIPLDAQDSQWADTEPPALDMDEWLDTMVSKTAQSARVADAEAPDFNASLEAMLSNVAKAAREPEGLLPPEAEPLQLSMSFGSPQVDPVPELDLAQAAEDARQAELRRIAAQEEAFRDTEARRVAEAAKRAEAERVQQAAQAEAARQAEAERMRLAAEAEVRRIADAAKAAEARRLAEAAEAARRAEAEQARLAAEAEAARQAEARQIAEAARLAEARRIAEQEAAEQAEAERMRLAAEAEVRRIAEAAKAAEAKRSAEAEAAAQRAEAERVAEAAEAARRAEIERLAANARAADTLRLTEAAAGVSTPLDASTAPSSPAAELPPSRVARRMLKWAPLPLVLLGAFLWFQRAERQPDAVPVAPAVTALPASAPASTAAPAASTAATPPSVVSATPPQPTPAPVASLAAPTLRASFDLPVDASDAGAGRMARELAGALSADGVSLRVVPAANGSDAIQSLREPGRLAIARADTLRAARSRSAAPPLRVVAPLYAEEVAFIVRADSPMRFIHDLRGRRINIGPLADAGSRTAQEIYRRMFGAAAPSPSRLGRDAALAELVAFRSIDAMAVVGGRPAAWLASLDARTARGLRLLRLDPRHAADRRALQVFQPASLRSAAGARKGEDVPTLAVTSFLVASGRAEADAGAMRALAGALCARLPALRSGGHASWRDERPASGIDTGWPEDAAAAEVLSACRTEGGPTAAAPLVKAKRAQKASRVRRERRG